MAILLLACARAEADDEAYQRFDDLRHQFPRHDEAVDCRRELDLDAGQPVPDPPP
jgi:hypothetical protein